MEQKAYIHSIETCGTVDGPGLRYVVFFQGCNLRCQYCHNPDTWKVKSGTLMTIPELIDDVLKYKSYMKFSGGGFTACGGEPLLQAAFISKLFMQLKEKGVHTALDTSGSIAPTKVSMLLEHTDLVLLDIKSLDTEKYKNLTGGEIKPSLDFAEYLSEKQIPAWIRYVVIPGMTDSDDEIEKLVKYLNNLSNIKKVELLPFHKLGEHKWETMDLQYRLKDTPVPSPETMKRLRGIVDEQWNGGQNDGE